MAISPKSLANLKPWKKGVSANPGGRPLGIHEEIRQLTGNGKDITRILTECMLGKMPGAKARDRLDAARYLADRLWGKPLEASIVATINDPNRLLAQDLTKEQLLALALAPVAQP